VLGAAVLGYGLNLSSQFGLEAGEWKVTWYSMMNTYGTYGEVIGTETFPKTFDYDPLAQATIREEPIGFKATLELYAPTDVDVEFTVGGDDGAIILYLDGKTLITLQCPDPNVSQSAKTHLTAGKHTLEIWYYQVLIEDDAAAMFDMVVPEQRAAMNIATGGGGLLFLGLILAIPGFLLKRGPS